MTDIPADTSTTATLDVGGSANGTLEVGGDHDWYAINLLAGPGGDHLEHRQHR